MSERRKRIESDRALAVRYGLYSKTVLLRMDRLLLAALRRRSDPNPFPHFHLFRRSPQS